MGVTGRLGMAFGLGGEWASGVGCVRIGEGTGL